MSDSDSQVRINRISRTLAMALVVVLFAWANLQPRDYRTVQYAESARVAALLGEKASYSIKAGRAFGWPSNAVLDCDMGLEWSLKGLAVNLSVAGVCGWLFVSFVIRQVRARAFARLDSSIFESKKRGWFQLHLTTCFALMVVGSLIVLMATRIFTKPEVQNFQLQPVSKTIGLVVFSVCSACFLFFFTWMVEARERRRDARKRRD